MVDHAMATNVTKYLLGIKANGIRNPYLKQGIRRSRLKPQPGSSFYQYNASDVNYAEGECVFGV